MTEREDEPVYEDETHNHENAPRESKPADKVVPKHMRSQRVAGRAPYGVIPNAAEANRKAYADHPKGTVYNVDYNIETDDEAMASADPNHLNKPGARTHVEDPHALGEGFGDPDYLDDEDEDDRD
jgi:hypothetical protein